MSVARPPCGNLDQDQIRSSSYNKPVGIGQDMREAVCTAAVKSNLLPHLSPVSNTSLILKNGVPGVDRRRSQTHDMGFAVVPVDAKDHRDPGER